MQYRTFEKTNEKFSLLGMGTMRLPLLHDGTVDEAKSISMIRKAIDEGINYVDTAYMYHDGDSEKILGKALKDGYRDKVFLADKMPVWLAKDEEDMKALFQEQLDRLDVDIIDMYLIHNINVGSWKLIKKYNALKFLDELKAEGKIKHIGFSFHDELPLFKEAIDAYPWDFCQIQLNYMDQEMQAGTAGLKYAKDKGLPVIVMEPLKGGLLTDALPDAINSLWEKAPIKRTPAEWAFRWVSNLPGVLTVLSGMSTIHQLDENLQIFSQAKVGSLTSAELSIIDQVANEYNRLIKYACTECNYCMPCPHKIDIPSTIRFYNNWFLYGGNPKLKDDYPVWIAKGHRASDCTGCKACTLNCPQHLPIYDIMKKTAKLYE
ncbi:MAG: aldo/keto reductase [Anaerovoracaceae bacterium]